METSQPGRQPAAPTDQRLHETTPLELRAERLAAEYLRVWGLRDPQTIARLSRHWVRAASEGAPAPACRDSLTDVYRATLRRATADMRRWIDRLAGEIGSDAGEIAGRRGLLAIELQETIDQFPAALLDPNPLPARLLERFKVAALPVVPPESPTQMPTQSLAPVAAPQYLSRWSRVCGELWRRAGRLSPGAGARDDVAGTAAFSGGPTDGAASPGG